MLKFKKGLLHIALSFALATAAFASPSLAAVDTHGYPPLDAWIPAGQPRLVILCLHGLGLHAGSYADLGDA